MQISGSQQISAPVSLVWAALNNPEILMKCLPGCESVIQENPEVFQIILTASVGPLKVKFNGVLRISDSVPPTSCQMDFEGQGGIMGFGKGTSSVNLKQTDLDGCLLTYTADAQVGGKLAQVGSRMIDSVARKMSDDFFTRLKAQLSPVEVPVSGVVSEILNVQEVEPLSSESTKPIDMPTRTEVFEQTTVKRSLNFQDTTNRIPAWWLFPAVGFGALMAVLISRYSQ
jgi:uncharacterized protein